MYIKLSIGKLIGKMIFYLKQKDIATDILQKKYPFEAPKFTDKLKNTSIYIAVILLCVHIKKLRF